MQTKEKAEALGFGDYCTIEQFRYGVKNEHYLHKVIGAMRSNTWVDVPEKGGVGEVQHKQMEDVVACICCGVSETEVKKFRLCDVRKSHGYTPANEGAEMREVLEEARTRLRQCISTLSAHPDYAECNEFGGMVSSACETVDNINEALRKK